MRVAVLILSLGVLAGASHQARAEDCPAAPDIGARVAALLEKARGAPDAKSARPITDALWELWAKAPNEQAQAVLDRGMRRRAAFDLLGAISEFDRLIAYCPTYAEGYNQRAFAHFIRQDYPAALSDLDRALALSPQHVAAMAGRALTLMGLGQMREGQTALRQALKVHPWLPERRMVIPPDTKL